MLARAPKRVMAENESAPSRLDTLPDKPRKKQVSQRRGATGGDIPTDLATLVEFWPTLSDDVKRGILNLAKANGGILEFAANPAKRAVS